MQEQEIIIKNGRFFDGKGSPAATKNLKVSNGRVVKITDEEIPTPAGAKVIRIGTKNFTEQLILGELMAQLIEAHTDYLRVAGALHIDDPVDVEADLAEFPLLDRPDSPRAIEAGDTGDDGEPRPSS